MDISKQALQDGQCVVIGLQTTGEARTAELVSEQGSELDDFVSGPKVTALAPPPDVALTFKSQSTPPPPPPPLPSLQGVSLQGALPFCI